MIQYNYNIQISHLSPSLCVCPPLYTAHIRRSSTQKAWEANIRLNEMGIARESHERLTTSSSELNELDEFHFRRIVFLCVVCSSTVLPTVCGMTCNVMWHTFVRSWISYKVYVMLLFYKLLYVRFKFSWLPFQLKARIEQIYIIIWTDSPNHRHRIVIVEWIEWRRSTENIEKLDGELREYAGERGQRESERNGETFKQTKWLVVPMLLLVGATRCRPHIDMIGTSTS